MAVRSFISIDIEDELIVSKIRRIQDDLLSTGAKLKLVEPQNLHYTLKFLGEIPEHKVQEITEILKTLESNTFKIHICELGCFPSINRINVIWLGAAEGSDKLIELAKWVEGKLTEMGFPRERKKFTPHLTIARVKYAHNKQQLQKKILQLSDIDVGEFTVSAVRLKKSTLTPKGPIYDTLYEVLLK